MSATVAGAMPSKSSPPDAVRNKLFASATTSSNLLPCLATAEIIDLPAFAKPAAGSPMTSPINSPGLPFNSIPVTSLISFSALSLDTPASESVSKSDPSVRTEDDGITPCVLPSITSS